ncbi:MAG: Fe-S cluster assembly ATPase SufC [Candidatus Levybacteria bacterium]|nr:Fe-S cluster assembly ATPase SufC [Candidatus Levybacteria bacterium]
MLQIKNFKADINNSEILKGVDLTVGPGEIHAIMGPNGAGKTTLALSLMGHPNYNIKYQISNIKYQIDGKDMSKLLPEERARQGLFISFQQPVEITGVSFLSFLRTAYKALHPDKKIPLSEFKNELKKTLKDVGLDESFMYRFLNEGFSGGEKKRAEIVQLLILRPKFAILDEIDSGLDVDSLKIVAEKIQEAVEKYSIGILLITHYQRILHYLKPDFVHVLIDGKIKKSGGMSLVKKIEKDGYAAI